MNTSWGRWFSSIVAVLAVGACSNEEDSDTGWSTGGASSSATGGGSSSGGASSPAAGGGSGLGGASHSGGSPGAGGGSAPPSCAPGTVDCSGACTPMSTLNCGACGTACSENQVCNTVSGTCECAAGASLCSDTCVDRSIDPRNCGGCGIICSGATPYCSNSTCVSSCAAGTESCVGACVDLRTSASNCGECGHACEANEQCVQGECVCNSGLTPCPTGCTDPTIDATNCGQCGTSCPSDQCSGGQCVPQVGTGGTSGTGGNGSTGGTSFGAGGTSPTTGGGGGTGGGATTGGGPSTGGTAETGGAAQTGGGPATGGVGTGGAAQTGGGPSTGGNGETTDAVTCTDAVYGTVSIPAGNMISDFADGSLYQIVQEGRGADAEPWHSYAPDDTNDSYGEMSEPGANNPKNAANDFAVDTSQSGPCSLGGSLHVSSPGGTGYSDINSFWGVGFGIDFMARTADREKQTYDASGYTGVGFWARCTSDVQFAFLKVVDGIEDADTVGATCSYGGETDTSSCNQYGIKNAVLTNQWTFYKVFFDEALQDPNFARFTDGVDPSNLVAFQIHVNKMATRSGTPVANPFECWIDDVHFLSEPTPQVPSETVTWTTSGNDFVRNGAPHKIRGLVRPSMEWDMSGFGITREDIQRMKAWKANAIRLAVKDTYYTGEKGEIYQKNVKRVVSWILEEGMDVILDLHYVAGDPTTQHRDFWTSVAADPFFQDGRIIFELYNEPTTGQPTLHDWMQATTTAIRAAGADNLILVSGPDYTFDISYYPDNPISGGAIGYVTHPYDFKPDTDSTSYLTPAGSLPVIATEFGDANVEGFNSLPPDQCEGSIYSNYINSFEGADMSWTAWAWIVDEWGCGFPQMIADYGGTPNAIGTPVKAALESLQ